jgi:hypothetical protein
VTQTRQERRRDGKKKMQKTSIPVNNESYSYTFFGKVLPERANVSISQSFMNIDFPDAGVKGELKLSIQLSQIFAQFTSLTNVDNIFTLRNYVDTAIRVPIDSLGYILGCGYDIEITSMIDYLGNQVVFGVGIEGNVEEFKKNRPKDFPEILKLSSEKDGRYLQLCFSDMREAIRNSKDAGFFCYRAIESLTKFFATKHELDKTKKKETWEKFRETLDIERDQIDFIQNFSEPVRHGDSKYISPEDMKKIYDYTWEMVDKYVVFAVNGYKK